VVVHGFGVHIAYAGHDMHGLAVGPDGRIYWSIGDKGLNVTSREGRNFAYPNEGAVMRIEPDGSNFEIYVRGNRNTQEPAFDHFGDLFAVDNDADMRGERERFVYLPEASDSGWRCNFQYMKEDSPWMREGFWKPHFPGQAAYLLPPLASYSDGPAGFKHDPGTALSEAQRGIFLLNEFPSGKMKGFKIERDGASFKMVNARVINDGIMGIGMSWHPDGSLMMVDWMGGYPLDELGALWRVDAKGAAQDPKRKETHAILRAGFTARAEGELVTLLGHADQRVRQGAQLELARQDRKDALLRVARDERAALLARIHALWGYGQLLRRNVADTAAVLPLLRDAEAEVRRQAVKILGDVSTTAAKGQGGALVALLSDASPRVREMTAIVLGKFREPKAVEALFTMAEKEAAQPVMRHAVVTGLTGSATAEQLAAKTSHPDINVRLASVVALRRNGSPAVAAYLKDKDALVVAEAARAIHDDLSIPEALPGLASMLEQAPRDEVIARRAINANLRLGTPAAAERLLAFALSDTAARELREEALISLRVWRQPPRLDRVDGYARTFTTAPIDAVLTPKLNQLLALKDPGLKTLAIEIMIAHALKAAPEQIAGIVSEKNAAGELRAQALRLMGGADRRNPAYARALDLALGAEAPAPLFRAAMDLLLPDDGARLVSVAQGALKNRELGDQQHAIGLLARAAQPAADTMLAGLGDALVTGTCAPGLKLDVLDALRARSSANPELAKKVAAYTSSPKGSTQPELLVGGSTSNGREIVVNHLAANCMACHSIEATGGSEVGPNLRAIGSQRDSAYLLESLIQPSVSIATGYGIVNLTLKDRTEVTGTLAKETPQAVTVRLFGGQNKTIARTDIAQQTPPVSIMPPMTGILQPREIRDVVAYLTSLQGGGGRSKTAKSEGQE